MREHETTGTAMLTSPPRSRGPLGTSATIACIGNLTIDETVHAGVRSAPAMGGDAAYGALAARLHLDDVRLFAPIGNDLPETVLTELRAAGIRAEELPLRALPTLRNIIHYRDDGSRRWEMLASESDFDALSVYPDDIPPSLLTCDGIVLSAMSLDAQLTLTPWIAANSEATLYLDLQEDYLDGTRAALFAIIAVCEVFLPSEIEATTLAETTDLHAAARLFATLGPRIVVIKCAERGSLVLENDVITAVAAEQVIPVDSTGAGDAFCAAFAAVHLAGGDAIAAARAGSRAAATAISALGIDGLLRATTAHVASTAFTTDSVTS